METVVDSFGHLTMTDFMNSMIKQEDLQRLVLFKNHYKKYMEMSKTYEEVLTQLSAYEEELAKMKVLCVSLEDENQSLEVQLQEKEAVLRKKEDELFAADEKIAQLEYEAEMEKSLRLHLEATVNKAGEDKKGLEERLLNARRERNEVQLKYQVLLSEKTEQSRTLTFEKRRHDCELSNALRQCHFWENETQAQMEQTKLLETQIRSALELQHLYRLGIRHLVTCRRPFTCRVCRKVRHAYRACNSSKLRGSSSCSDGTWDSGFADQPSSSQDGESGSEGHEGRGSGTVRRFFRKMSSRWKHRQAIHT